MFVLLMNKENNAIILIHGCDNKFNFTFLSVCDKSRVVFHRKTDMLETTCFLRIKKIIFADLKRSLRRKNPGKQPQSEDSPNWRTNYMVV